MGIIVLAILVIAIYFSFFFYYSVNTLEDFQAHQKKCARTIFINDVNYTTFEYKILGEEDNKCEIQVKVLQIKQGTLDKQALEGKIMVCSTELESTSAPESNLKECHGLLKEEIQNILINNCHSQIVANIGEVSQELSKII